MNFDELARVGAVIRLNEMAAEVRALLKVLPSVGDTARVVFRDALGTTRPLRAAKANGAAPTPSRGPRSKTARARAGAFMAARWAAAKKAGVDLQGRPLKSASTSRRRMSV